MLEATAGIPGAVPLSEQAGVRLRRIRTTDCQRLARIYRRVFRTKGPLITEKGIRRFWIDRSSPLSHRRSIMIGNKVVGYCGWDKDSTVLIYLAPEYQGRAIGTKAMQLLLSEARIRWKKQLAVVTDRPNFWTRLGFKEKPDYRGKEGKPCLIWHYWGENNYGPAERDLGR